LQNGCLRLASCNSIILVCLDEVLSSQLLFVLINNSACRPSTLLGLRGGDVKIPGG
jgi:hypothetical protein